MISQKQVNWDGPQSHWGSWRPRPRGRDQRPIHPPVTSPPRGQLRTQPRRLCTSHSDPPKATLVASMKHPLHRNTVPAPKRRHHGGVRLSASPFHASRRETHRVQGSGARGSLSITSPRATDGLLFRGRPFPVPLYPSPLVPAPPHSLQGRKASSPQAPSSEWAGEGRGRG